MVKKLRCKSGSPVLNLSSAMSSIVGLDLAEPNVSIIILTYFMGIL